MLLMSAFHVPSIVAAAVDAGAAAFSLAAFSLVVVCLHPDSAISDAAASAAVIVFRIGNPLRSATPVTIGGPAGWRRRRLDPGGVVRSAT
jgi:hypothetical protein